MSKITCLILFVIFFSSSCQRNSKKSNDEAYPTIQKNWRKIPDEWINKALKFNYQKVDTTLFVEFSRYIKPDTIAHLKTEHVDPNYGLIFNSILADLDGDQNSELICLQGWDVYTPNLCVFKQIDKAWYLIYKEEIDTFYNSPTLTIAGNYSSNKTFYLRRVYDHGSGVYIDGYSFYKLENNKVYKCLKIINDAHIYGWGLYLNQSINSDFEFMGDIKDELDVNYSYNFFPGSIYPTDFSWDSHEEIPLISGQDAISYIYDKKAHQYKLDIPKYKSGATDLTAEKIDCFGDFGNDSLFVKAFRRHIDMVLKIGTPIQKKLLNKYLKLAEKNKTVHTEILELKKHAGGTSFYGPSN
ncbi:MAG TPA: hypothetical protein VHA56_18700 [Mucilaginibacter sp.]|nr:hypothetical protein [Mucilaginibacter sp.]